MVKHDSVRVTLKDVTPTHYVFDKLTCVKDKVIGASILKQGCTYAVNSRMDGTLVVESPV